MLTQEEKDFMDYWEQNRDKQKRIVKQFLLGIPVGLLFAIPIAINFLSGWYKRATMTSNAEEFPGVLLIALLIIVGFIAIFSRRHRWDQNEQRYQELKAKQSTDTPE